RWGYIQGLLRRRGRESIIQRIGRFQEEAVPDRGTVQAVNRIHDSVPKPYIVSASLAAAAFYNWVSDVLSHLNNVSKNATDPDDDESFETIDGHFIMNSNKQSAMTSRDDVGNMSQDEGFLDGQDTDSDKHAR
ncbi:hypothetical protein MAR_024804, partial [Mya arenaria]